MPTRFKFPASERLKSLKLFRQLMDHGSTMKASPVLIKYMVSEYDGESHLKAAFSVTKKKFSNATDRNRLKRQMREAYRLNSGTLREKMKEAEKSCLLIFIYTSNKGESYQDIESSIRKLLPGI